MENRSSQPGTISTTCGTVPVMTKDGPKDDRKSARTVSVIGGTLPVHPRRPKQDPSPGTFAVAVSVIGGTVAIPRVQQQTTTRISTAKTSNGSCGSNQVDLSTSRKIGRTLNEPTAAQSTTRSDSLDDYLADRFQDLNVSDSTANATTSKTNVHSLSPEIVYCRRLLDEHAYYQSLDGAAVAMAEWNPADRRLKSSYCIVSSLSFMNNLGSPESLLICTCKDGIHQRHRLNNVDNQEPVTPEFLSAERDRYCIHGRMIDQLRLTVTIPEGDGSGVFEQMQTDPVMMWLVKDDVTDSYGVIQRSRTGRSSKCVVCCKNRCEHLGYFERNLEQHGFELPPPDFDPTALARVISRKKIPMDGYILRQYRYPAQDSALVPGLTDGTCHHGHSWSSLDPLEQGWVAAEKSTIFNGEGLIYDGGAVYFRKTCGNCDCQLYFDGSELGLLNFNNRVLVEYTLLFRYVSFYSRSGLTLKGFYDNILEFNRWQGKADSTISYDRLYTAWNAFVSLVRMDEKDFICQTCGKDPETIILDGTALSCAKRYLPSTNVDLNGLRTLHGADHKERVFVRQQKARTLLKHYATGKVDGKEKPIGQDELKQLLEYLECERPFETPLRELVAELSNNGTITEAPEPYRRLLRELAKNTPICAAMQVGDEAEVMELLERVASGRIDIFSASDSDIVAMLHRKVPAIMECLLPIRKAVGTLPTAVRQVLQAMMETVRSMYENSDNRCISDYTPIDVANSSLSFFPNWPVKHGIGKYEDSITNRRDESDACTKLRHGHKVLGPGIITYLCPHGISYGFTVMDSYESPKMAFEVFLTRYRPKNVVYDNACKLHLYCLKREPVYFMETRFFVDRFHWFNHTACSIGYNIKNYKSDDTINSINSQACEQLNSSLVKLRSSLSYMRYEKFFASLILFLAFRNRTFCA